MCVPSASNQPSDSARQSDFTAPHAGVCRKLTDGRVRLKATCSAVVIVRTECVTDRP